MPTHRYVCDCHKIFGAYDLAKGQFDAIALHAARAGISLEQSLNDGIAQVLKLMETNLSDAACALKEVAS